VRSSDAIPRRRPISLPRGGALTEAHWRTLAEEVVLVAIALES